MRRPLTLFSTALTLVHVVGSSPPVKVALKSSWASPPLYETILETVSLEYPDKFFYFLNQLSDPTLLPLGSQAGDDGHEAPLDLALASGIIEDTETLARIKMSLALSVATPKLEAFYNYYESIHGEELGANCESWVDWYGEVACGKEALAHLVDKKLENVSKNSSAIPSRPKLLTFDHIYPPLYQSLTRPPLTAILYGVLSSPNFRDLHAYLLTLANSTDPHIEYVFRPIRGNAVRQDYDLAGYGVSLDLKKMDYLALDDRNLDSATSRIASQHKPGEKADPVLPLILAYPEPPAVPDANTPLTAEELAELGNQAVQIISSSPTPLTTLIHLSQNFPKYATSLSRRVITNSSIADELQSNSLKIARGITVFWLNGLQIDAKDVNPFGLLRLLRKEKETMKSLVSQGMTRGQAFELLTHPEFAIKQGQSGLDAIFDASDRVEGGGIIVWWNDIEKDSRYEYWSPSLYGLMRPMYPGAMPNVRLNIFNVVLVLDLSRIQALNFLVRSMSGIINHGIPLRFGLVPSIESEDGKKMAQLFYHVIAKYGRKKTLEFLRLISELSIAQHHSAVNWDIAKKAYHQFIELLKQTNPDDSEDNYPEFDSIIEFNTESVAFNKIAAYTERLDCTLTISTGGHAFINGKHLIVNDDFIVNLQSEMNVHMNFVREQLYQGALSDENKPEEMANYFYDLSIASKRRNAYIYPSQPTATLKIVNIPSLFSRIGYKVPSSYVYPPESLEVSQSLFVIADLDTDDGLDLVKEALLSLTTESRTRITFLHNPAKSQIKDTTRPPVSWLLSHLYIRNLLPNSASTLLAVFEGNTAMPVEGTQTPLANENAFESLTGGVPLDKIVSEEYSDYVKQSQLVARELGLLPGQKGLIVNGRLVGPIDSPTKTAFRSVDFQALEQYEFKKRTDPLLKVLRDVLPNLLQDNSSAADVISMSSSIISSSQQPDPSEVGLFDSPNKARQRPYELLSKKYTSFEIGNNSTALYHIAVFVDPLSTHGQKWSSIIQWLSNIPDVFIEVRLNPGHYEELPLKRFYRYNLPTECSYANDKGVNRSTVAFEDLPIDPIFTLAMDVPTSWLVRPREALYDLDNIQLGKIFPGDESVDAIFALDYIVIEGHARELSTRGEPPRGVQLQLSRSDGTAIDDTQVVANLGYFQFKAKPGVFHLDIRPGRGQEIFKLDSAGNEGWDSPSVEAAGNEITITSFEGLTLYPRLSRLPGEESADVLKDDIDDESQEGKSWYGDFVRRLQSLFQGAKWKESTKDVVSARPQADINIFTVASGLLYERFVGIMILSVLRNTNSTVKFWFIENFLSPAFLEFIPHMAEKYNFQYELVTYKWPSWLRAQTEKQRVIWAYKILFLDVLFPMDLKKVIFVDADQIVRTDLKELIEVDLHGAPYGYTPMGDDNKDMEGFRFWKGGYWAQVLRGRPYHISALYVIDLQRFRQLAAGDILRGHYHQLSSDPNSLSNLDQDLPNNLQDQVPIHSLHEDWLWCETWCSKDRLHRAKTIDLCQNPLTKEPKLARARQIPEWEQYDAEIAQFTRELSVQGKIHSRIATADANVLAGGAGAGVGSDGNTENDTTDEEKVTGAKDVEESPTSRDEL